MKTSPMDSSSNVSLPSSIASSACLFWTRNSSLISSTVARILQKACAIPATLASRASSLPLAPWSTDAVTSVASVASEASVASSLPSALWSTCVVTSRDSLDVDLGADNENASPVGPPPARQAPDMQQW
eukprot:CAMPEP_0172759006 /NCGR_PEP_ID=MMETSP1074-20121228/166867_1 /TAXON_ID=2916 /ORGANISM="Ceratium fusus, Strain PA161109" /LENGTH=128 /DNA_ID=CAMNT_0013592699 /DNA_START=865 /DNA_END=1249 /DNA_ORIENTATION=-